MASTTPSPSDPQVSEARRALGRRLREIRLSAGLTIRALATAMGHKHYSRISRIETGAQWPAAADIRSWCAACDATGQQADLLAELQTAGAAYLDFRRQARTGLKTVLGPHTPQQYEQTSVFRIYEHNVIPGLFQTPDYTAAMLRFWATHLGTTDFGEAVTIRLERQKVLQRGGKRFVVLLEEQALRTWFGTGRVQAGQLGRLLEIMTMPQVSLGIIPLMIVRPAVGSAGFWIFDDDLVALETPTAAIQVTQPGEIALYARLFEALKSSAVYGPAARALIMGALSELD